MRLFRKIQPDKTFPENCVDDNVRDLSKVKNERAIELLKTFGQPGFTSLEESIKKAIESL